MIRLRHLIKTQQRIYYKNWKGHSSVRRIRILDVYVGATPFHRQRQLLIHAYDFDRKATRDYAAKDILKWF